MKYIIKKSIVFITAFAIMLTLAMPMSAEVASKKAPKLNKTKTTLTITKKKTKPAVLLKVKNAAERKVKWASSNKKVVTVSKNGKVVAKKKGTAIITVKVKGSKTLRCKVTVKDNRKSVTKKPAPNPTPSPSPKPSVETECQHVWINQTKTVYKVLCSCGEIFENHEKWIEHDFTASMNGENNHSYTDHPETIVVSQECKLCHKTRPVQ